MITKQDAVTLERIVLRVRLVEAKATAEVLAADDPLGLATSVAERRVQALEARLAELAALRE